MQNDCQACKAFQTAYQNNPEEFDGEEREELFSDVNLEEGTMFTGCNMTTKLSSHKKPVLVFSASKVPASTSSCIGVHTMQGDEDVFIDNTIDQDPQPGAASSTQAGMKRSRSDSEKDAPMMPKMQKIDDGTAQ
ncbi:hypothetical protein PAXINDRAFT_16198 [Paxillus involutus ATCC 200175]|uniref:Unplaced genomic scaffold PAXINscaffold_72, whole genome shotgun sequence n=1 Tax=Paxillus involutus ATCC 200175 TaxID=664439 RepID=A0A0C9TSN4_PAXIN|nr:hypothetical protein PAXINDRAFT_16198 [Paxillus involutus ATCC 200175]